MISIVTPSFGQLEWLRLCLASVADQEGVEVEHIVHDAGTAGVEEVFADASGPAATARYHPRLFVEKDRGMYDAINRGLAKTSGDICAYLNCDEQYLPGALRQVVDAFRNHPRLDILFAGSLVVDGQGEYICSRPALKPSRRHLNGGHMYNLTSSLFFRPRLFRQEKLFFNPDLRIVGDMEWLSRAMDAGAHIETAGFFTSVFSDLGTNLALSEGAAAEVHPAMPPTVFDRLALATTVAAHRVRRLMAGHYSLRPFQYQIYTRQHPNLRQTFRVEAPTGVWRNRL